jgi:hypothetical protein
VLGLWRPPELAPTGPSCEIVDDLDAIDDEPDDPAPPATDPLPAPGASTAQQLTQTHDPAPDIDAVEIDRLVPASGNLGICGQQFWLGPARAGRKLTLWIDTTTVHLSLDGQHLKTLPSRLTSIDLARLHAHGARRTRRNPPQRQRRGHGLHRRSLPLRRPTIRRAADHSAPGNHRRSRHHRRDARPDHPTNPDPDPTRPPPRRPPGPAPLLDQRPARVQRTVSCRGGTQIVGQRVQVGLRYAGQIVTIEVDETTLRVYDHHDHLIKNVPRTSRKEARRHKAYGHTTNHKTG